MCSTSGSTAATAPRVATSPKPRRLATAPTARIPVARSQAELRGCRCGIRSLTTCSSGPSTIAARLDRTSEPVAAPVAAWSATITPRSYRAEVSSRLSPLASSVHLALLPFGEALADRSLSRAVFSRETRFGGPFRAATREGSSPHLTRRRARRRGGAAPAPRRAAGCRFAVSSPSREALRCPRELRRRRRASG